MNEMVQILTYFYEIVIRCLKPYLNQRKQMILSNVASNPLIQRHNP